jgi:hypothetical protein
MKAHEKDGKLTFTKTTEAEDEISILWKNAAKIENSEQASEAARLTQIDDFWPKIESLAVLCDEILSEHGFPNAAEMVRHDGAGKWRRHAPDAPKRPPPGETWKVSRGKTLAQEFSPDFSDSWYAGRIGFECWPWSTTATATLGSHFCFRKYLQSQRSGMIGTGEGRKSLQFSLAVNNGKCWKNIVALRMQNSAKACTSGALKSPHCGPKPN